MTVDITVRLPDLIVEFIDNKITLGEFLSRNDHIRHILRQKMEQEELLTDL